MKDKNKSCLYFDMLLDLVPACSIVAEDNSCLEWELLEVPIGEVCFKNAFWSSNSDCLECKEYKKRW